MKTLLMRYLLVVLIISMTSCAINILRPVIIESDNVLNRQSIGFWPSISSINVIESKNSLTLDEGLSFASMEVTDSLIQELGYGPILRGESQIVQNKISTNLFNFIAHAHNNKSVESIRMSSEMHELLDKYSLDHGIGVFSYGFNRTPENQKGQVVKSIGLAVATLGMFTTIPVRSNLTVCVMIFDRNKNRVIRYREATIDGRSPNESETIEDLLHKTIGHYLNES